MRKNKATRLAIIGAGPLGIEAALRGIAAGLDVTVYERSGPGANIRKWQHINYFSPWSLNRSAWGEALLLDNGHELKNASDFPTGGDYLENYLLPLAAIVMNKSRIYLNTQVVSISRDGIFKGQYVGRSERSSQPFILLVRENGLERYDTADIIIDASGVYRNPNHLGPGGMPAIGESSADLYIDYYIPDFHGNSAPYYANKRLLVVGDGHSASTTLFGLSQFQRNYPDTEVYWVLRHGEQPYEIINNDPLPERAKLSAFGNRVANNEIPNIRAIKQSTVHRIELIDGALQITLQRGTMRQILEVDRVIANVGYRPDTSLWNELQIHQCYASDGPMKLAASLMANDGGVDCLAQSGGGVQTLMNPEPNFYILGAKSYGRHSNFLLRIGFEQVDELFTHLT